MFTQVSRLLPQRPRGRAIRPHRQGSHPAAEGHGRRRARARRRAELVRVRELSILGRSRKPAHPAASLRSSKCCAGATWARARPRWGGACWTSARICRSDALCCASCSFQPPSRARRIAATASSVATFTLYVCACDPESCSGLLGFPARRRCSPPVATPRSCAHVVATGRRF